MTPVALVLALALTAPVEATSPAEPEPAQASKEPSAQRVWGVGLLAGGSALLAATATGAALLEALTRPDDPNDEVEHPELLQGATFTSMILGAGSVALMLAGGALVIAE